MEPNRYWLLYFGLLFVFLGSKVETSYAHCGGGYGYGHRNGHGGYCYGYEDNEG
jgi:hypothetical protein